MYELEFVEGEGWSINKGEQCYEFGIETKEEAQKLIEEMENESRATIDGQYID